ncbi:hypothetical protein [Poriferisphaera sp. WC338]|uniref:hypothetical protein n=1 Tax=Poriferisphaera sp. WC338 TaxID=3425129 RepID=UPI003D812691
MSQGRIRRSVLLSTVTFSGSSFIVHDQLAAINVVFDYTYDSLAYDTLGGSSTTGFFTEGVTYADGSTGDERRAALEHAASFYENAFSDTLSAINPTGGINSWNAALVDPSGNENITISNLQLDENEVRIFVGAQEVAPAAFAGPGAYQVFPDTEFADTVLNRGQGTTIGPEADDYSLWGGIITFNSNLTAGGQNFDWNFSLDESDLDFQEVDFLSVAVHELGHVFGFGSANSFDNLVTSIEGELFFTGDNAVSEFGGELVPLDDIAGHFEDGLLGNSLALDPSITLGTRNLLQALDYAVFADLGWDVDPSLLGIDVDDPISVPTPTAAASMLLLLGVMLTRRSSDTIRQIT